MGRTAFPGRAVLHRTVGQDRRRPRRARALAGRHAERAWRGCHDPARSASVDDESGGFELDPLLELATTLWTRATVEDRDELEERARAGAAVPRPPPRRSDARPRRARRYARVLPAAVRADGDRAPGPAVHVPRPVLGRAQQEGARRAARRPHEGVDVAVRRARVPLRDRRPGGGPPGARPQARRRGAASDWQALRDHRGPRDDLPARRPVRKARSAAALSATPERSRSAQPEPAARPVPVSRRRAAMAARVSRVLRRGLDRRRLRRAARRGAACRTAPATFDYLAAPEEFLGLLGDYAQPAAVEASEDIDDEVDVDEDADQAIETNERDRWIAFLSWIGVNRALRPVHFHDVEDDATGWLTTKDLTRPNGWAFRALGDTWERFEASLRRRLEAQHDLTARHAVPLRGPRSRPDRRHRRGRQRRRDLRRSRGVLRAPRPPLVVARAVRGLPGRAGRAGEVAGPALEAAAGPRRGAGRRRRQPLGAPPEIAQHLPDQLGPTRSRRSRGGRRPSSNADSAGAADRPPRCCRSSTFPRASRPPPCARCPSGSASARSRHRRPSPATTPIASARSSSSLFPEHDRRQRPARGHQARLPPGVRAAQRPRGCRRRRARAQRHAAARQHVRGTALPPGEGDALRRDARHPRAQRRRRRRADVRARGRGAGRRAAEEPVRHADPRGRARMAPGPRRVRARSGRARRDARRARRAPARRCSLASARSAPTPPTCASCASSSIASSRSSR